MAMAKGEIKMNTIKVGLCFLDLNDKPIVVKPLKSNWSVDVENKKELSKSVYRRKVQTEIASVLTDHIKMEITDNVIREMLEELET